MPKNILIITAIIVAVIAIGVTASYITLRQGGKGMMRTQWGAAHQKVIRFIEHLKGAKIYV
jgi:hypothetical protein